MNSVLKIFKDSANRIDYFKNAKALGLSDIELHNKLIVDYKTSDEPRRSNALAGIMCKNWNYVPKMTRKVRATGLTYDDCVQQLAKCCMAGADYCYEAMQKGENPNGQAYVRQLIASRGTPEIIYQYNRLQNKANVNCASLDANINTGDDADKTLGDLLDSETQMDGSVNKKSDGTAAGIVQELINRGKILEAIIADNIAFGSCEKITKKTKTIKVHEYELNKDTGEQELIEKDAKVPSYSREFSFRELSKAMNEIPDSKEYRAYFINSYRVATKALDETLATLRADNAKTTANTKLKRALNSVNYAIADMLGIDSSRVKKA